MRKRARLSWARSFTATAFLVWPLVLTLACSGAREAAPSAPDSTATRPEPIQALDAESLIERAKDSVLKLKSMRVKTTTTTTANGRAQTLSLQTEIVFPVSLYTLGSDGSGQVAETCMDGAHAYARSPAGQGKWREYRLRDEFWDLPRQLVQTSLWYLQPGSVGKWTLDSSDPAAYRVRAQLGPSASGALSQLLEAMGMGQATAEVEFDQSDPPTFDYVIRRTDFLPLQVTSRMVQLVNGIRSETLTQTTFSEFDSKVTFPRDTPCKFAPMP